MTTRNLTDNEIKKALECASCIDVIRNDVLDLINLQEAENERLNKEVDRLSQCVLYHDGQIVDAKAEAYKDLIENHSYPHPESLNERIVYVNDIVELMNECIKR